MSGREQNSDSYIPGMGMKNRKDFDLNSNLKASNDPEENGLPWTRQVKEDSQGNTVEIGKKEALNILGLSEKNREIDRVELKQDIKTCPHCGGELPNES